MTSCLSVSAEEVMRRPDDYKNKPIVVTGKVIQIAEETHIFTGTTINIRLREENDDVWLLIYTNQDVDAPNGNILEGDYITIYGDCTGTTTYKTILGQNITVPSVSVVYISAAEETP